jgi:hypothetical protein
MTKHKAMRKINLIPWLFFLIILAGCNKKENTDSPALPAGYIDLSQLKTKHDYYLPFSISNDSINIRLAILNRDTVDLSYGKFIDFPENGFYELLLQYTDPNHQDQSYLFTTKTVEREFSEWGIRAWVPTPYKTSQLGTEEIEMVYPHRYSDSIKVPFIFYVKEAGAIKAIYCQGNYPTSGDRFNIKRGVGSVNLEASKLSTQAQFTIGGKPVSATLTKVSVPDIILNGSISNSTEIPANSLVRISGNLAIESTGSLTVKEGAIILIDEGVDINISGPVIFSGTSANPILVTCSKADRFWGGFITNTAGGTVDAQYTIFCQSGIHDYYWGHAQKQALFYTENSILTLDHCFMLDHIGQVFYPQNATLNLDNILVQRVKTGGQINYTQLFIHNSVFTDFPYDSAVFVDNDNDALYLNATNAVIDNTQFMFATDDGLDSGLDEGGDVTVTNCRFEACFHEGAALSSRNLVVKHHIFKDCVFTNCGQGLEMGFSSPNHTAVAENCMFINNGIGIRYGDNYDWSDVNGKMYIKNCYSLFNDKDVWNMVRMIWSPKLDKLSFENTLVSQFCPQYPELEIIGEK